MLYYQDYLDKKNEQASKVTSFCFYGSLIFGIAITLILFIFQKPLLGFLGSDSQTYQYASEYYFYIALGAPLIILSLTPGNLLRCEALAVESMIATILGSVVNIVLDPLFISVFNMGAKGAAIATVIGYGASDLAFLYYIKNKSQNFSLDIKKMNLSLQYVQQIMTIGIPASLTNIMQSFFMMMMNRYLVVYGNDKIAAMGIALKVSMIIMLVMVGFAFGAQPLLGYNYGAKNQKRLKEVLRFDIFVQCLFSISVALILGISAPFCIHLFMNDANIVSTGSMMLRCLLISTPAIGIVLVLTTLFQSANKAMGAFLLSFCRQGLFFYIALIILAKIFGYTGILFAPFTADIITMLLGIILYQYYFKK